jgi:hypothetical protein
VSEVSERAVDLHDQVPRKLRYQLLHPDTEFFPPCEHDPMWRVRLDGGGTEVKAMQLVDLMERLERLDQVDRASLAPPVGARTVRRPPPKSLASGPRGSLLSAHDVRLLIRRVCLEGDTSARAWRQRTEQHTASRRARSGIGPRHQAHSRRVPPGCDASPRGLRDASSSAASDASCSTTARRDASAALMMPP